MSTTDEVLQQILDIIKPMVPKDGPPVTADLDLVNDRDESPPSNLRKPDSAVIEDIISCLKVSASPCTVIASVTTSHAYFLHRSIIVRFSRTLG